MGQFIGKLCMKQYKKSSQTYWSKESRTFPGYITIFRTLQAWISKTQSPRTLSDFQDSCEPRIWWRMWSLSLWHWTIVVEVVNLRSACAPDSGFLIGWNCSTQTRPSWSIYEYLMGMEENKNVTWFTCSILLLPICCYMYLHFCDTLAVEWLFWSVFG